VHLILAFIFFEQFTGARGLSALAGEFLSWPLLATMLPALDLFLPALINESRMIGGTFILGLFAAICELLRLIFAMLMVKILAQDVKDYDSAEKAQFGAVAAGAICGGSALIVLVVSLIARAAKSAGGPNIAFGFMLLIYLGFAAITVLPLIATHGARASLARKARRG
jgi:hypothetical protein